MGRIKLDTGAFTLAEIVVVITIISILSTIALVTFTQYTSQSRDAVRLTDVENIETGLNIFQAYDGGYPNPSNGVNITLDGAIIWTQGVFWPESAREMWKVFWELKDPLYGNHYSYSITSSKREYQLAYILEKSNSFWQSVRGISYESDLGFSEAYASSVYNVWNLDPVIWLDWRDIDGDWDETDNPSNGATITNWINKWTRGASWNPTITHGTVTYEDNAVFIYQAPLIWKSDGMRFENSAITQGEIYYVLHDSGWKASWYALQWTQKKYAIGSYKNYRNALRINNAPNHINTAPAIKNKNKRKAYLYSFLTDNINYEFRNTGNLLSQWATSSISGVTWAINKAWWYNKTNELADWAIWELIIFDTTLSDDERFEVEGYLAHKWLMDGYLPAGHPYVDAPPTGEEEEVEEVISVEIQEFPDAPVYITGNYNKLLSHGVKPNWEHIVVTSPSIITSDVSNTNFLDIVADKKFVYTGYENIPAAYEWNQFTSIGGLDFNIEYPIAFSWSRFDLSSYSWIKEIDATIRTSYEYAPFYKDISDNFANYQTWYVENILGDVIGINPIKPYYCSEILDRKFIYNIALEANIDASPTGVNSWVTGVWWLNNEVKSTEWKFNTEFQTDTLWWYIELRWEEKYPVGFLRIHNSVWQEASYLSWATIELYKSWEIEPEYSHPIWDTSADYIVDLDLEGIWELHDIDILRIEAAPDKQLSIREIEVYIGGNINSGFYVVDSDGIGWKSPYQVYCDMVTDGWGWTRVGDNFIDRANFDNNIHPTNFDGYLPSWNKNKSWKNTLRSDITPPSEIPNANVLRHTDDINGYYELYFDNIPNIEFTTEIRLWAWVKGTQKSPFHYIIDYEGSAPSEISVTEDLSLDPNVWRYETIRIPVSDVLEDFTWQIGKWINASVKPLDVTWISFELFYK